jgi:leucine dehydrogenase
VLDHESVPTLQMPIVAGAANNQLADDTIADLLAERGILWAPDFVANAGGIINIAVELGRGGYDPDRARTKVEGVGDTIREIYDLAQSEGDTPFSAALALAQRRVDEA